MAIAAALALAGCQWLIYFYAPIESGMGLIQKIFYIHLPFSIWALLSFFLVFAGSIVWLARRQKSWDNLCVAAAELGVTFCTLSLATGMIWAKKSWGVWWTWDPRLSTTLVLWFIYAAYLALGALEMPMRRKALIRAVLGIVAFLDVPLVFLSARIFRSIHPAVFASREGGLEPEMKIVAICCVLSLGLLWGCLLRIRKQQLDAADELDKIAFCRNNLP